MSIVQFFKAYDLRGTTPELNAEVYYWSGFGLIETILKPQNLPLSVIITRDCRLSSLEFYNAFAKGIIDSGGSVILLGIGTTDLMYAASMKLNLSGAMITASHNPPLDNGLKIVKKIPQMLGLKDGLDKIRDFVVCKIEIEETKIDLKNTMNYQENSEIKNQVIHFFVYKIKEIGRIEELIKLTSLQNENIETKLQNLEKQENLSDNSIKNKKREFEFQKQFKKFKVVVDTANGMGGFIMPYLQEIYKNLVDFVPLFWALDGSFPNHAADPMNPENLRFLSQKVLEEQADFGIAMDGDADRAFFVDENGNLISGEHLVALFAEEILNDNFENGEPKIEQIELNNNEKTVNLSKENIVESNNLQDQENSTLSIDLQKNSSQSISKISSENLILGQNKSQENVQKITNSTKTEIDLQDKFDIQFNPAIVYVISYSRALPDTVLENNGIPIISKQGHTFVKSQMNKYKAIYGGEASGHHYFGQFGFMDSGAITIAIFIKILIQKNLKPKINQNLDENFDEKSTQINQQKTLKASQLCKKWSEKYFVSGEQNFVLPKNLTMAKVVEIIKENYSKSTISELDGITVYDILSKFTIRGSNTEPLLRINVETKMENKTKEILDKIKKVLNLNS